MAEVKISSKQRYELKKFIKELGKYRGRHTEHVTVYIPAGYELAKIINHLAQEQGTASNIESTATRKNVTDALERMIQHLRLFKQTPSNGLMVFSGNVAEKEGQSDVEVWSVEPPIPLGMRLYRCDKDFKLDALTDMIETKEVFGMVVLDRRDAMFALLKGKKIIPLTKTHSEVPGKFRAGGQCIHPDSKIETKSTALLNSLKIGDVVKSYNRETNIVEYSPITDFWKVTKTDILKIDTENDHSLICSKDHILFTPELHELGAEEFSVGDHLLELNDGAFIQVKITSIEELDSPVELIDISVANQNFIANGLLVHNSAQRFARLREGAVKEHYKKIAEYMKEQFLHMKQDLKGILIGGPSTTTNDFMNKDYVTGDLKKKIIAIKDLSYTGEFGLQELLEKSSDVLAAEEVAEEKAIMNRFLTLLATKPGMVTYGSKETMEQLNLGSVDTLLLSEDLDDDTIEEYETKAEELGSKTMLISVDTREGVQLRDFGKIAALLRYDTSHN